MKLFATFEVIFQSPRDELIDAMMDFKERLEAKANGIINSLVFLLSNGKALVFCERDKSEAQADIIWSALEGAEAGFHEIAMAVA